MPPENVERLGKRHAEEFVCDICEIEALTCWFVDIVTKADVRSWPVRSWKCDHRLMYDKHHTAMP